MKMITYAAALMILAAMAACNEKPDRGAAAPNAAAQQYQGTAPATTNTVPPSQIRQLRDNVLTNQ